jgi:hypothetical protein
VRCSEGSFFWGIAGGGNDAADFATPSGAGLIALLMPASDFGTSHCTRVEVQNTALVPWLWQMSLPERGDSDEGERRASQSAHRYADGRRQWLEPGDPGGRSGPFRILRRALNPYVTAGEWHGFIESGLIALFPFTRFEDERMDLATKVMILRGLVVVAAVFFVIGVIVSLIKPKWVLFWVKSPDRLMAVVTVSTIAMLMFMAGWTGIAKLTLKPKEPQQRHEEERGSRDDQNMLQLNR